MNTQTTQPIPYVYQEFPKWKYHPTLPARIVQNAEEEKALGKGWYNTPNDLPKPSKLIATIERQKSWFEKWDWLLKRIGGVIGMLIALAGLYLAWRSKNP
jgi:hypothetical protein